MIVLPYEGKEPKFAARVFVAPNAAVIGDVELADDVSIWFGVVLRGDINQIRVGARSNIQDNCVLHVEHDRPALIGEQVTVGHSATVHACFIGNNALIGIGATVLSHAVVGERAIVGAGALVPEGMVVPPQTLVLGVPGRVKRDITKEELERIDRGWKVYVDYKNQYLREAK